jgi:hypothetical protein
MYCRSSWRWSGCPEPFRSSTFRSLPTTTWSAPNAAASRKNRRWPEWSQSKQPVTTTLGETSQWMSQNAAALGLLAEEPEGAPPLLPDPGKRESQAS